jgi:aminoacyl-tRNA hydrolase
MLKAKNALRVKLARIRTRTVDRIWPHTLGTIRYVALDLLVFVLALYRRSILRQATFIGITGSCGKTTTKELVGAVLDTRFTGQKNRGTRNALHEVIRTVLRVGRADTYCVQELSIARYFGKLTLRQRLRLLRPTIGVVTNIGTDHLSMFKSRQGIAEEKGKLIGSLPRHGIAVLNADDPLVLKMAGRCAGRVVRYGTVPDADVRGTNVTSVWPQRLTLTVHVGEASHFVETQLCGTHWAESVLAALAVGLNLGVPLDAAVEAIKAVAPFPGRMSPTELPSGAVVIRDDWKAPLLSFAPALKFMREARAPRKIVVVGTISDFSGPERVTYVRIAREACSVADYVFFVGPLSSYCLQVRQSAADPSVQAFATIQPLAEHLRGFLRPGDLVLVKGSPKDDLARLIKLLRLPETATARLARAGAMAEASASVRPAGTSSTGVQLVVGLGNPEKEYEGTRHNVGHTVVDRIAASLGTTWTQENGALVARIELHGRPVYLVKLLASMNTAGPALRQVGERLDVGPEGCVLVYDDMHLPLGKVRERMKGSAGGHKGVFSIITTYQSEDFRRVKIGIGEPPDKKCASAFVLSGFSAAEEPLIGQAVGEACTRVIKLLDEHLFRS